MTSLETFEYNPEMESYETGEFEWGGETGGEVSSEAEVMELAGELTEITEWETSEG
jgi:hypothetical protein